MGAPKLNRYYVHVKGKTYGPYTIEQIFERAREGRIRGSHLLWCEGMEKWETAKIVLKKLKEQGYMPPLSRLPESSVPMSDCAPQSVANAELIHMQQSDLAPMGKRFAAFLLDSLILGAVIAGFHFAGIANLMFVPKDSLVLTLVNLAIFLVYEVLFSVALEGTPGKLALGIRTVDFSGQALTIKTAVFRALMKFVSGVILCVGFILAFFDVRRQSLHDRVASTLVVKRLPATPQQ